MNDAREERHYRCSRKFSLAILHTSVPPPPPSHTIRDNKPVSETFHARYYRNYRKYIKGGDPGTKIDPPPMPKKTKKGKPKKANKKAKSDKETRL